MAAHTAAKLASRCYFANNEELVGPRLGSDDIITSLEMGSDTGWRPGLEAAPPGGGRPNTAPPPEASGGS